MHQQAFSACFHLIWFFSKEREVISHDVSHVLSLSAQDLSLFLVLGAHRGGLKRGCAHGLNPTCPRPAWGCRKISYLQPAAGDYHHG